MSFVSLKRDRGMKNKLSLGLGFFMAVATVHAGNYPQAEKIVNQVCAACHGADGNSAAPENPVLAGQIPEYIQRQLEHFKSGARPNPIMQGMAAPLSDSEINELGRFFAEQKVKPRTSKNPKLVEAGRQIYRGGVMKTGVPACMACHGPAGAGIPLQYPRLAGQHASYIVKQLQAFKHNERGAHKSDMLGKVMIDVANKMTEEEMAATAEYISALR